MAKVIMRQRYVTPKCAPIVVPEGYYSDNEMGFVRDPLERPVHDWDKIREYSKPEHRNNMPYGTPDGYTVETTFTVGCDINAGGDTMTMWVEVCPDRDANASKRVYHAPKKDNYERYINSAQHKSCIIIK